jgi:hypothetical protein
MYRSLIESLLGWLVLHLLKNTKVKSVAINSTECMDLKYGRSITSNKKHFVSGVYYHL